MSKAAYAGPLEQVDACCYRIPKSYRPDMRVDGLIFANETLVESIKKDQAPDQVANVATLPGIQSASLAMPDIHWGYGFCIGGVCATDPADGGVISPGGVGYDINCLPGDTPVRFAHGYTRLIGELDANWRTATLECLDVRADRLTATGVDLWFGQEPRSPVMELTTDAGDRVRATSDHPFWTPHGMQQVGSLAPGCLVAVSPFEGVPYEEPPDRTVVAEEDVVNRLAGLGVGGNRVAQVLGYLRARRLLPLAYRSPAFPYLCKLVGFVLGDGSLHHTAGTGKGVVSFYGGRSDLEEIRADLAAIGVCGSQVYSRERRHHIHNGYAEYEFARTEEHCKVVGTAFAVLLECLGVPAGNKAAQPYDLPGWLAAAPRWQKRLFLAALFGAELSAPCTAPGHGTVFAPPTLTVSKRAEHAASGRRFLEGVAELLGCFGITAQSLREDPVRVAPGKPPTVRLKLILSPTSKSLRNLWGKVGFVYNAERSGLAALAVQYLKLKDRMLAARHRAAADARAMAGAGEKPAAICSRLVGPFVNRRFLERALYDPSKTPSRTPRTFATFEQYRRSASAGADPNGVVWERVAEVRPVEHTGPVYDFTVRHHDHNFVAGGFVVSNCGVRLVKTNLFLDDMKHRIRELVKGLFHTIPAGAGKGGRYRFDSTETRRLMGEGPRFVIDRDLGAPRDLTHTEAHGRIEDADPDEVSDFAVKRGSEQCGTLGSGNHFLEVQVVDSVFDPAVAKVFGLELNQVCVMIHSGSRGLGYQVCDDALAVFRNCPAKYGITLPDRQLACAPAESPEGRKYIAAMRAAANFGFCNRQLLMQQAREVFAAVFGRSWDDLGMELLYDVAHNIAKLEEHTVDGKVKQVWVHRKGATRAFPAGHPEVPEAFRAVGQPVIIPGDMGRVSWVLVGAAGSMERTFGSTCHGAGRAMSRTAAKQNATGRRIDKELEARGVIAMASSRMGLAEEQPSAYKNVDHVVDVVHAANLSRKVARMRPIGVIKG
jgi:tRNA-splicing ligase RtcB